MNTEQQHFKEIHREAVILAEMKRRLGLSVTTAVLSSAAAHASAATTATVLKSSEEEEVARNVYDMYGLSMATVNAYLLRYLRSKGLNIDDAVAKLRRRRAFEQTLPMISITPITVAALRSGAFYLLNRDLEGRPVLYINVAAFTLPTLELDEAQRILVIISEFMQAQCLLKNNEDAAEQQQRRRQCANSTAAANSFVNGSRENNGGGTTAAAQAVAEIEEAVSHLQQFTLLINEEGGSWALQASFLNNLSILLGMLPKYYPLMLGAALVLGASFEVRTAIKACLSSSSADVRESVQMIERDDLPRYMDARNIPIELGGRAQLVGSAMHFSDAVLRHWFALTTRIEEERVCGGGVPDSKAPPTPQATAADPAGDARAVNSRNEGRGVETISHPLLRPLYVPPPPLGTTQRGISLQRHAIEFQHLSSNGGSIAGEIIGSGSLGLRQPSKCGGSSNTYNRRHDVMPLTTAVITAPHGTLAGQKDMAAATVAFGTLRTEDVTDDGVCSALSAPDDCDDGVEDEDSGVGLHTPNSGVPTYQLYTAASSSLAGSLAAEGEMHQASLGSSHNRHHLTASLRNPASATMSREEAAHFVDYPDDAIAALRQERRRRQRAEQALQFRDLGVALDMRNASRIERELAAMHQDLNVLVAEILVKAEAARTRQNAPPTLKQLLDLTLTAFENATRTPSTVPAMVLAEPAQRDAVSSRCCIFM
ncbi:hypothetical protein LPMP_220990 [Leishmania panamensis]|uniref:CRAL-TRIO domain-containing protein n=1 Tax=Leishmania panamensis TaxID=5679 RepID=A0A088RQJ2_LEIPA|nr:hypothetical protein LPMP_220990 [Leishmania panamensis]AIN98392.1 hypothetical protein LPMP_220990 [Leishmania panamensis]